MRLVRATLEAGGKIIRFRQSDTARAAAHATTGLVDLLL